MRRIRMSSLIYLASIVVTCGYIGSDSIAGADVSRDPSVKAVLPEPGVEEAAYTEAAKRAPTFQEVGLASWYGERHQGSRTASGERFDANKLTAAHRTLPLDTVARVTNLENGRSVEVKVNDRGPYVHGRVIDLSAGAARALGIVHEGVAMVRIEALPTATRGFAVGEATSGLWPVRNLPPGIVLHNRG
jgi:peptidoglycan lytic transglycosylase